MDMGMVTLVMEGRVPSQVIHRDIHCGREFVAFGAEQIPPCVRVIVSEANRILTPQGDNVSPDNENKSLDITFEMNGDYESSTAAFIDPPEYETDDPSLVEV